MSYELVTLLSYLRTVYLVVYLLTPLCVYLVSTGKKRGMRRVDKVSRDLMFCEIRG